MKKIFIHVGLHKTGSTYLQDAIWPQASEYSLISRPYTQHNHAFNQMQYADDTLYNKGLIKNEISKFDSNPLLISDENFSGKPVYFSYLNRSLIAKRLYEIFPSAEIILFIRDQIDIMKSHYSSYIKMPFGIKKIDDLFYNSSIDYNFNDSLKKKNPSLSTLYYNTNDYFVHMDCFKYSPLIEMYQKIFKKCHIFLYEDLLNHQNEVLDQLSYILGHKLDLKKNIYNKSLSPSELSKQRFSNKLNLFLGNNRYIRKIITNINKINPLLSSDKDLKSNLKFMVKDYYKSDNQIIKKLLTSIKWDRYPNSYL